METRPQNNLAIEIKPTNLLIRFHSNTKKHELNNNLFSINDPIVFKLNDSHSLNRFDLFLVNEINKRTKMNIYVSLSDTNRILKMKEFVCVNRCGGLIESNSRDSNRFFVHHETF